MNWIKIEPHLAKENGYTSPFSRQEKQHITLWKPIQKGRAIKTSSTEPLYRAACTKAFERLYLELQL